MSTENKGPSVWFPTDWGADEEKVQKLPARARLRFIELYIMCAEFPDGRFERNGSALSLEEISKVIPLTRGKAASLRTMKIDIDLLVKAGLFRWDGKVLTIPRFKDDQAAGEAWRPDEKN